MAERSEKVKPWRANKVGWDEKVRKNLRDTIKEYRPLEKLSVENVNILMIGPVGSGKSSYFNTLNSAFRGHVTAQAVAGTAQRSLTTHFRTYPVRPEKGGRPLNFRLCDTVGIGEVESVEPDEFRPILDGNVQDRALFSEQGFSQDHPKYRKDVKLGDKIHVAAFFLDATNVTVMSQSVLEKLRKIRSYTNLRGIPMVVVITKVDEVCEHVRDDLETIYHSAKIAEKVQEVADKIGVPKAHILVVKNYESEVELQKNVDILALVALRQMLRLADNFLDDHLDQLESSSSSSDVEHKNKGNIM